MFRKPVLSRLGAISLGPLLFASMVACGLADADEQTLTMMVTATPLTIPVGSSVTISTSATGQSLFRTVVEYGDGFADSIGTVGSEHRTNRTHTYNFVGAQTIRATAFDALLGETFDEVTVDVQDTIPGT